MSSSLEGVRVIDFTQAMAGPFVTMLLGDLGADIIKIEPLTGDQTRRWFPPSMGGLSAYFLSVNRNKRSLAINLKTEEGRKILRRLAENSDVVVENFRPGTMERLGLTYEIAREINPQIVYCSISGYGQNGPRKDQPGYDLTVLANSGLLYLNGEPGRTPVKFGVPIADIVSGLFAGMAILSALLERSRSGEGQYIDLSMLDANFLTLTHQLFHFFATGENPERTGTWHPSIAPYQIFGTQDGHIVVAIGTEKLWMSFCSAIGREDLAENPLFIDNSHRVKNRSELIKNIEATLRNRRTDELTKLFESWGIPAASVRKVEDVVNDPQITERKMLYRINTPYGSIPMPGSPFKMSRTPGKISRAPPRLGEDSSRILEEIGFSSEYIRDLRKRGIVGSPE